MYFLLEIFLIKCNFKSYFMKNNERIFLVSEFMINMTYNSINAIKVRN
jgi:hypothetical protein